MRGPGESPSRLPGPWGPFAALPSSLSPASPTCSPGTAALPSNVPSPSGTSVQGRCPSPEARSPLPHFLQEPAPGAALPPLGGGCVKGRRSRDPRSASLQGPLHLDSESGAPWCCRSCAPPPPPPRVEGVAGPRGFSYWGLSILWTPPRRATRWRASMLLGTPQSQEDADREAGLRFWHSWITSFSLF